MKDWLQCCWQALCTIIPFLVASIVTAAPIAIAGALNKPLIALVSFPVLVVATGTIIWMENR